MEEIEKLLINILISGNSLALILFGLGQLTAKKKTVRHYLAAAVVIAAGINILADTAFRTGISYRFPHMLYASYPLEYLMGPLLYLFLMSLVYREGSVTGREKLLFLPAGAVFLLMLPYYLQPGAVKLAGIPFYTGYDGILGVLYRLIDRGIEIWLFFCFGLFLLKVIPHFLQKQYRKNSRLNLILVYASLWMVWLIWYALVVLEPLDLLYSETVLAGTYLALGFFFFYMRNPDLLAKRKIPLENRTGLEIPAGGEIHAVLENLETLMEREKPYLDENLSMPDLASLLGIPSYRLSEILNRDLDTSFKHYINCYRLKNARELLVSEPESSIIDIAFRSGFRSKSAFNDFFKNHTGMTPSRFRRSREKVHQKTVDNGT